VLVVCLPLTRQQISYWQNSETLFRRALAVTSNNWMAHYNLGEALDQQRRIDEAMHQYELAFQCQPNYAEPHNNLGVDLAKSGQTEAAISQYTQAIQRKPGYADAWNNLNPDEAEVHKNLGEAMDKQGRIGEAINDYQSAVQLNPQDAEAFNNLGVDYARQGRFAAAAEQFQQALKVRPDYADAGSNLGYLWTQQGEHLDEALALIQRAHQADPKNSGTLDNLGWVLFKLNRPAEGLDYARQAVQYSPQPDASIYDHLGDIYAALHQRDMAAGAWRQSLAISAGPDVQKKLAGLGGP
jgi:superkiller protein 3